MKAKLSEIAAAFAERNLIEKQLGPDLEIKDITPAIVGGQGNLVFVSNASFVEQALQNKPSAVVTTSDFAERFTQQGMSVLVSKNVPLAHALLRQKFADRNVRESEWGTRHASALVHETAQLDPSVVLGPNTVIGARTKLAKDCVIMAGTVIEHDVVIAEGTVVHPNVVIGYKTEIGKNVIVKAGTTIGMEGFGFEQDEKRVSYRVPQTGKVVIEDDVVIGANNCVDRATYGETRICRGTKFDNLCHVAHNVRIGEDCLLTAGFIVAGSTTLGNRVITSGQTGILDHLKIADDVVLLHRAGVTNDMPKPGLYAGLPPQPLQPYLRNMAVFTKLADLRKKVRDLEKALAEKDPTG